jgi:hypothetical protein
MNPLRIGGVIPGPKTGDGKIVSRIPFPHAVAENFRCPIRERNPLMISAGSTGRVYDVGADGFSRFLF